MSDKIANTGSISDRRKHHEERNNQLLLALFTNPLGTKMSTIEKPICYQAVIAFGNTL